MRWILLGGLSLVTLATGCSSYGVSGAEVNEQFANELDPSRQYRLGPGDTITVSQGNELDRVDVIRQDGIVSTAFGEFEVAGLTLAEAEAKILAALTDFEKPSVSVFLTLAAPRFIWVGGEVARAGPVIHKRGMTGLEAVMESGGNTPTGKMWNILLVRWDTENTRTVHRVNLKDFQNPLLLLPRDIVYVPRTNIGNVNEFVTQYIRGILPFNPAIGPL